MSTLAIGWRGLSAETQDRLIRDTWLLMAGWIVIGLACSWLLLELFHLRSPLVRYPITALVMYGLGVVAGTRLWLAAFSRAVRLQPGRFGPEPVVPAGDARFRRRTRAAARLCLRSSCPRRARPPRATRFPPLRISPSPTRRLHP